MSGRESTPSLIFTVLREAVQLIQNEMRLAKVEAREGVRNSMIALVMLLVGTILAVTCLNLIAGAMVSALVAAGHTTLAATLWVGGGFGLLAVIIFWIALHKLKTVSEAPQRVADNLRRDAQSLKGG